MQFLATKRETVRVVCPSEADSYAFCNDAYKSGDHLKCPQDLEGVTYVELRALTPSERRAAQAMAPAYPGEDADERVRTAWVLELQRTYLAFGLVAVDHDEWTATKSERFLGYRHWSMDEIDRIPDDDAMWLGLAVYRLSHPK